MCFFSFYYSVWLKLSCFSHFYFGWNWREGPYESDKVTSKNKKRNSTTYQYSERSIVMGQLS